jgi:hypothetical protein
MGSEHALKQRARTRSDPHAHSCGQEIVVAGNYQVRVMRDNLGRDTPGHDTPGADETGVPRITRTPARVEIATARRELVFADRDALQQFIDACIKAREEAFGVTSNPTLSKQDKEAWARFFGRFTEL